MSSRRGAEWPYAWSARASRRMKPTATGLGSSPLSDAILAREAFAAALRVLSHDDLGGAHRHAAREPHHARDAAAFGPARRARMAPILKRAEHRAHAVFHTDVGGQSDLDVAHEGVQRNLRHPRGEAGTGEVELDVSEHGADV